MTDDHANDTDEDAGGLNTPGGGPRRVVSERSVDDVLEAVRGDDADDGSPATETTRLESDRADEPADGTPTSDEADDGTAHGDDEESEANGEPEADGESAADDPETDGEAAADGVEGSDDDPGTGGDDVGASDDARPGDDAGADDEAADGSDPAADADALAARVEAGDVTGADVRAAEAGEGRDSTPEIDEVDLSLEDLDGDRERDPSEPASATAGSDDGPLAGSIGEEPSSTDSNPADDDSAGLLGRLRGLFSRSS